MKVVSVNVSEPREIVRGGQTYFTGIFKEPVSGPVLAANFRLEGDGVGSPKVHGGEFQAIYAYAIEDYRYWQAKEPGLTAIKAPIFGENLTVEGLNMEELCLGDTLRVGEVSLMATLPRIPCKHLGMAVEDVGFIKKFLTGGRNGIYFRIAEEGRLQAGDSIEFIKRDPQGLKIYDLLKVVQKKKPASSVQAHIEHPMMCPRWREMFFQRYA